MRVRKNEKMAVDLDVKRFQIPFIIEGECPSCENSFSLDLLSYPKLQKPFEMYACCEFCDHEWSFMIELSVSLGLVEVE